MLLSILIPSVPNRRKTFMQNILDQVETQISELGRSDIEVLCLYDNKRRKLGEKRNNLLDIAKGRYLVFIDDDDVISDDYIEEICYALDNSNDVDCVVYDIICTINDGPQLLCKYGVELNYNYATPESGVTWTGKPTHTHVWKSSLVKEARFPLENYGEDVNWVQQVWHRVRSQARIDKVLYYYKQNSAYTETR